MAVTILTHHPENYTKVILPKLSGYEDRDIRAYPLPPRADFRGVNHVIETLRAEGRVVTSRFTRERLVDWSKTRRADQHDRERYESDGALLHFVGGGWDGYVVVDGVEHRLEAQHLRMPLTMLATWLRGRP